MTWKHFPYAPLDELCDAVHVVTTQGTVMLEVQESCVALGPEGQSTPVNRRHMRTLEEEKSAQFGHKITV